MNNSCAVNKCVQTKDGFCVRSCLDHLSGVRCHLYAVWGFYTCVLNIDHINGMNEKGMQYSI